MNGVHENAFETNAGVIIAFADFRMWDEGPEKYRLRLVLGDLSGRLPAHSADAEVEFGSDPDRPEGGQISNLKYVVQLS